VKESAADAGDEAAHTTAPSTDSHGKRMTIILRVG
jgi:hypothetical protein